MSQSELSPNNDFEFRFRVLTEDEDTGRVVPATGLTNVTGYFADTPSGAAIHSSLSVTLAERSQREGSYAGIVSGGALASQLGTRRTVWRILAVGTAILRAKRLTVQPYLA